MFYALLKTNFNFSAQFNWLSANAFNLDQSKNLLCSKELNVTEIEMMEIGCEREENIMGKRENTGYQHFVLFPQGF